MKNVWVANGNGHLRDTRLHRVYHAHPPELNSVAYVSPKLQSIKWPGLNWAVFNSAAIVTIQYVNAGR